MHNCQTKFVSEHPSLSASFCTHRICTKVNAMINVLMHSPLGLELCKLWPYNDNWTPVLTGMSPSGQHLWKPFHLHLHFLLQVDNIDNTWPGKHIHLTVKSSKLHLKYIGKLWSSEFGLNILISSQKLLKYFFSFQI